MKGSQPKFVAAALALMALSACQRNDCDCEAEPIEPPPYGEEEANVEVWLDTLEVGSRELYAARENVVAAVAPNEGAAIADIGAGTGLYTLLFAERIGEKGVVYAVDIEPRFLKLINQRASDLDLKNVVAVLGRNKDITLPPESVDLAFIADTYHYFDNREAIMQTVREALKPGGRLIILDYYLDEASGDDPERVHVRFGKDGLVNEVTSFGFKLAAEPSVEGLSDIYMVVFEKAPPA